MKLLTGISLFIISWISLVGISDHYLLEYPDYFPTPTYNLDQSPISEAKVELGRALFYDPILSADNTISCASCHSPYNAFAHTDHDLSHGIGDAIGTRNAPPLFNLAWNQSFMWDGAINHLDMQSLAPISHPDEMGETLEHVVTKLQASSLYPALFNSAFGDSTITGQQVLKALSQFQLTLISANSKYDQVQKGETHFTEQEQKGYLLFQQNCNSCHQEPLFTTGSFANNGLAVDTTLNDYGRWMITKQTKDSLQFKIPSLRNLTYTYPYMHDGRFRKIRAVLNHYTDTTRQNGLRDDRTKLELTSNEKTDLVAFLLTLNDSDFVFDRKHQFPRKKLMLSEGN